MDKTVDPLVWVCSDNEELEFREKLQESVKKFGDDLRKGKNYCLRIKGVFARKEVAFKDFEKIV